MIQSYVPFDLDARLGHWGVTSDFLYFRAVTSTQVGPRNGVNVNVAGEQTIWEMAGYYRVGTWALDPKWGNPSPWTFSAAPATTGSKGTSACRLRDVPFSRPQRDAQRADPGRFVSVGGSKDWWDPFAGPRVTWNLDERFKLFARGDVGGFGIEGCSNSSGSLSEAATGISPRTASWRPATACCQRTTRAAADSVTLSMTCGKVAPISPRGEVLIQDAGQSHDQTLVLE